MQACHAIGPFLSAPCLACLDPSRPPSFLPPPLPPSLAPSLTLSATKETMPCSLSEMALLSVKAALGLGGLIRRDPRPTTKVRRSKAKGKTKPSL